MQNLIQLLENGSGKMNWKTKDKTGIDDYLEASKAYVADALNNYGVEYISEEFGILCHHYHELAQKITNEEYDPNSWTHQDLLRFIEDFRG